MHNVHPASFTAFAFLSDVRITCACNTGVGAVGQGHPRVCNAGRISWFAFPPSTCCLSSPGKRTLSSPRKAHILLDWADRRHEGRGRPGNREHGRRPCFGVASRRLAVRKFRHPRVIDGLQPLLRRRHDASALQYFPF
ncbi:hypothetical protein OH77DRAFT_84783 [Trametes cingulata]|nr:hypothetical protein OH77DRAFT_84783 [Trametes cingulata]